MNFNSKIRVYGDITYRGKCPTETNDQITFFNWMRRIHPDIAVIATHIRNEGKRTYGQAMRQKAEGMTRGASDVIIPTRLPFVCEIKRADHTKSRWQDGQQEYLLAAQGMGAFACVALGIDGSIEAFNDWRKKILEL